MYMPTYETWDGGGRYATRSPRRGKTPTRGVYKGLGGGAASYRTREVNGMKTIVSICVTMSYKQSEKMPEYFPKSLAMGERIWFNTL